MSSIKVTVGLVPYVGVKYLPYSLPTLLEQDYPNIEFLILDQEEGKYTATKWVETERPEWLKRADWSQGPNLMHSGGMNRLMSRMTGDIFICVSQDMLYPKDFVSKIAKFFQEHEDFDFATARLLRWDFEKLAKTNTIDSLGLKISTWHQAFEIGQGHEAKPFHKEFEEIFGASGAVLAMRRSALEKVKYNTQVFDESLHYKNDVDLAYRLQWAGCRGALLNDVIVYHDRFMSAASRKPFWVIRQSLHGDWVFILKNFSCSYHWLIHIKTYLYLIAKTVYFVIRHPSLVSIFRDLWRKRSGIADWRRKMPRNISVRAMEDKLI